MTLFAAHRAGSPGILCGNADADVALWANQVVVNGGTVSPTRIAQMSTLVSALKACTSWTCLDDLWMLVAENAAQALTSFKQRRLATAVNSPAFTLDRGYAFNGSSNYIDTGFVESTMSTVQSVGEHRLGVYERTNNNNNTTPFGASDNPSGALNCILRPRSSANFMFSQMHSSTATGTDTITDSRGLSTSSRTGNSTTVSFAKNGVSLASVSGVTGGTALLPRPYYIGANNNAGVAASFRASTIGFTFVGKPLTTPSDRLPEYNAYQAHMTALGAQV